MEIKLKAKMEIVEELKEKYVGKYFINDEKEYVYINGVADDEVLNCISISFNGDVYGNVDDYTRPEYLYKEIDRAEFFKIAEGGIKMFLDRCK